MSTVPYSCSVAVSSFNNDNRVDLAVIKYGSNSLDVFLGYSDGSFVYHMILIQLVDIPIQIWLLLVISTTTIKCIIVNNTDKQNVGSFFGHGDGSFSSPMTYPIGNDSYSCSDAIGDLNNDNHMDIVVANSATHNMGIFLGYGDASFLGPRTYSICERSYIYIVIFTIGDFNNDNKIDIAVANNGRSMDGVLGVVVDESFTIGVVLNVGHGT